MLTIDDLLRSEHLNNVYKDSPKYRQGIQSATHNIILNIFCPYCGDFIEKPNIFRRAMVFHNLSKWAMPSFWMTRPIVCRVCANLR